MAQLLHKRARTTQAIRRDIQNSQESIIKASKRFGVNPKTIAKWRKRDFVEDVPMGPKVIKSTVLSEAEEKAIVAFRQMTLLPLDDVLYAMQETIPHLSRSSLHRCLSITPRSARLFPHFLSAFKALSIKGTCSTSVYPNASAFFCIPFTSLALYFSS